MFVVDVYVDKYVDGINRNLGDLDRKLGAVSLKSSSAMGIITKRD